MRHSLIRTVVEFFMVIFFCFSLNPKHINSLQTYTFWLQFIFVCFVLLYSVYRVNAATGWKEICSLDPLEAYYKYYDLYDERNTLFLVVSSSSNVPRVSSDDLIAHFRYTQLNIFPLLQYTHYIYFQLIGMSTSFVKCQSYFPFNFTDHMETQ